MTAEITNQLQVANDPEEDMNTGEYSDDANAQDAQSQLDTGAPDAQPEQDTQPTTGAPHTQIASTSRSTVDEPPRTSTGFERPFSAIQPIYSVDLSM